MASAWRLLHQTAQAAVSTLQCTHPDGVAVLVVFAVFCMRHVLRRQQRLVFQAQQWAAVSQTPRATPVTTAGHAADSTLRRTAACLPRRLHDCAAHATQAGEHSPIREPQQWQQWQPQAEPPAGCAGSQLQAQSASNSLLDEANTRVTALEQQLALEQQRTEAAEGAAATLQQQLAAARKAAVSRESQHESASIRISALEAMLAQERAAVQQLQQQAAQLSAASSISSLQRQHAQRLQASEHRVQHVHGQLVSANAVIAGLHARLDESRQELADERKAAAELRAALRKAHDDLKVRERGGWQQLHSKGTRARPAHAARRRPAAAGGAARGGDRCSNTGGGGQHGEGRQSVASQAFGQIISQSECGAMFPPAP
jgi:hypothetical protein